MIDTALPKTQTLRRPGTLLLAAYVVLYGATLFGMNRAWNFDVTEPLFILAILGIGFSLAAWLLTLGSRPLPYEVRNPGRELGFLAIYLILLTAYITWAGTAIRKYVPTDPAQAFVILGAKLLFFVVIPGWMMCALFGYTVRDLVPTSLRGRDVITLAGMAVLLIGFQAVLGRGLRDILQAHVPASMLFLGLPIAFVWLAVEAGVVEEFFFRVLLQSRLAAATGSELAGIVLMAVLFGLAHAPGLYLRTGITQEGLPAHPPLLMAVGYSIVITSVAGFFLGVLWTRTRNLILIVLVHAAADLLPDFLSTLHSLRLLR